MGFRSAVIPAQATETAGNSRDLDGLRVVDAYGAEPASDREEDLTLQDVLAADAWAREAASARTA